MECALPHRSDSVELALKLLEGGNVNGTVQPASRHRRVPEQVSLNATKRPRHACTLSDGSELRQPIDVMTTAAHTALVILDRWRHLATRGYRLSGSDAVAVCEQAQTLAACIVMIDDLTPRLETVLRPFAGAKELGGITAQTWHAWCAEAGRQVLWRGFPGGLPFGTGTITALIYGRMHAAEIAAKVEASQPVELPLIGGNPWLREIQRDELREVGRRVLGEHSEAWREHTATTDTVKADAETEHAVDWASLPGHLQTLVAKIIKEVPKGTAFAVKSVIAEGEDTRTPTRNLEKLVELKFLKRAPKGSRSPYRWTTKPRGMPDSARLAPG